MLKKFVNYMMLATLIMMVGCEKENGVPVRGIDLVKKTLTLEVGEAEFLEYVITPSDATNRDVTWVTKHPTIANVSSSGEIEAISTGETEITVTTKDGNRSATCIIKVNARSENGKSSECDIVSFKTADMVWAINNATLTITAVFSKGTNLSNLAPTIVVSNKATVNPASGVVMDFSDKKEVIYTVTAEDGTVKVYTARAEGGETEKSSECDIISFIVGEIEWEIDNETMSITAIYPAGEEDLSSIAPTIVVSDKATVNPASGVAMDFSDEKEVVYTVTAEDGTVKVYTARAVELDNIQCFATTPAVVGFDNDTSLPTIKTAYGVFFAPELQGEMSNLFEGDAILASFCINYNQQPSGKYPVVSDLQFLKVEVGFPIATQGGESETGDFDYPIKNMDVVGLFENVLFFAFQHKAPIDQKFIYEMTFDDIETDIPVLYIRAKKDVIEVSGSERDVVYPFAFNMFDFFMEYKNADNKVKFMIKYKTGEDVDGNEIFRFFVNVSGNNTFEISVN